jgi:hypothetical protein
MAGLRNGGAELILSSKLDILCNLDESKSSWIPLGFTANAQSVTNLHAEGVTTTMIPLLHNHKVYFPKPLNISPVSLLLAALHCNFPLSH